MNYAHFKQWVLDRVEELVAFGVSRDEAEHLMMAVELGGIEDEARNRRADQFLLDFKRVGAAGMAERLGISEQSARKRRNKLLNRTHRLRSRLREA